MLGHPPGLTYLVNLQLADLGLAAHRAVVADKIIIADDINYLTPVMPVMLENSYPYYLREHNPPA
jgi:hypothetical protein